MTRRQDLHALADAGVALAEKPSTAALLRSVAHWFEDEAQKSFKFGTIYNIEFRDLAIVAQASTEDTAAQPIVDALNARGIETENNLGSMMSNLEIDKDDLHEILCSCHGAEVTGETMAGRLRALASKKEGSGG